jgi:hypothetical protein
MMLITSEKHPLFKFLHFLVRAGLAVSSDMKSSAHVRGTVVKVAEQGACKAHYRLFSCPDRIMGRLWVWVVSVRMRSYTTVCSHVDRTGRPSPRVAAPYAVDAN